MNFFHRYPTREELYALEERARRERARVIGRMFARGLRTASRGLSAAWRLLAGRSSAPSVRKHAGRAPTPYGT